jgi:hypothetical protein
MPALLTVPLFAALLFTGIPAAQGTVYKCSVDKGSVVYQDQPCGPGKELRNLDTDPATLSIVPGTPVPGNKAVSPATRSDRTSGAARPPAKQKLAGDAAQRRFIREGMSEGEVIFKIGRPDVSSHARKGVQWAYLPAAGDSDTLTTLTFTGGKVSAVERKIAR